MKRIGIDARYLLSLQRGMPLYVTRLCQLLPGIRNEYQFYYFINMANAHNDSPENYQPRLDAIMQKYSNVKIINCNHDAEFMWEQVYLRRLVKEHKIDLLHMPGNRICFFPGVPTVVTVHDVMEMLFIKRDVLKWVFDPMAGIRMCLYRLRQVLYIWATYRYALKEASHTITVSDFSADEISRHLGISSERITAIHHGLDEEFTLPEAPVTLDKGSRRNVLMLGGDAYQKNVEGALAAWSRVPIEIRRKFPLKIIGFCGNQQSPLIKALHDNKLTNEVQVSGWVSQETLICELRSAALFLYVSRYEGFGFPPLHAMASGTPVVASNVTSIPEVLGEVGLKCSPDDHTGIADGIVSLLTNEQNWLDQAQAGIKRAKDFSWELSARRHMQVYEEIFRLKSN
jgi:glycosyltransferase involved in cell wall biosynthesis